MADRQALFAALALLGTVIFSGGLSGCGGESDATIAEPGATPDADAESPAAKLGFQLFGDTNLSVSGRQACVTCHVPSNA
jgi:cytochrome c peroxidase